MSSPVRCVHKDTLLGEAKTLMTRHNISSLLVDTGPDDTPGFITKRDFLKVRPELPQAQMLRECAIAWVLLMGMT